MLTLASTFLPERPVLFLQVWGRWWVGRSCHPHPKPKTAAVICAHVLLQPATLTMSGHFQVASYRYRSLIEALHTPNSLPVASSNHAVLQTAHIKHRTWHPRGLNPTQTVHPGHYTQSKPLNSTGSSEPLLKTLSPKPEAP